MTKILLDQNIPALIEPWLQNEVGNEELFLLSKDKIFSSYPVKLLW